ncbi:MAG: Pr6Pr family membrane protein [Ktedonobacterales bacterium]|nr:Pr6Pr family membrane protein [Ktedonobacterales bacterium]
MTQRPLLLSSRYFFGSLAIFAIVTQLIIHVQHGFDLVNYFGYFTNLSNIFGAVILLVGAYTLAQQRTPSPTQELVRGAATVAMTIVGLIWFALLRGEDLGALLPWVNGIVHILMPIVMVVDWLVAPSWLRITFGQVLLWLSYPLVYLIATLLRGALTGWYPYPFLNPAKVGGAGVVALYCLGIFGVFLVVGYGAMVASNRLFRQAAYPSVAKPQR